MNSFYLQYKERMATKKHEAEAPQFSLNVPSMVVNVEGMTCEHCKAKVENGLRSESNISNAIANTETNTVSLFGENISSEQIEARIKELGYIYQGEVN